MSLAGLAGCLGNDDEDGVDSDSEDDSGSTDADDGDSDDSEVAGEDTDDPEADDGDTDDANGGDEDPYLREELENAMANLSAPDPGTGVVVFENEGEYQTEEIECGADSADPDDPERGTAEGVFEFDDGEASGVELSRGDDLDDLQNTITLTVPNPDEESQFEEAAVPRSIRPIKPEEGAEGRSAFVVREAETWYGGIGFDLSDQGGVDYGETWVAITCA
ncbi:hypothetical protein [Natronorarus salvus]|uniref:hypothetical protein n=1 Tax=Natronorarus salvus TaxID=3117733 RepID=UPI002F25FCDD